jgi:hypothetical protein
VIEKLERLAAARINLLPAASITTHFIFERDGFVALVERKDDAFGRVGAAGLATEQGFAALLWRGEQAYFVGRGVEVAATPEQVAALRNFQRDLEESIA